MRLTAILILVASLQVSASSYSQNVNLDLKKATLKEAFESIRQQTGYSFLWSQTLLNNAPLISVKVKNASINEAMNACLKNAALSFDINGKVIYIEAKKPSIAITESAYITAIQKAIHGKVTDTSGKPINGATVIIKGTKKGTITDTKGHYSLQANPGDVLRFSFVGYQSTEMTVGENDEINVSLSIQPSNLSEVVIVGYGKSSRKDLNSAVSTMSMNTVAPIPVQSINDALGGRIPGVIVTASNGAPGAKSQISIRGGNTPLFVIDGIIRSKNDFENLNPNDIATFSVLKDAAATSLYGARGGNGVVLVTTKKGESGKANINYSFNQIFSQPTIRPTRMGSYDHALAVNKIYEAEGKTPSTPDSILQYYKDQSKPYLYPSTDWQELFLKNFAPAQRHDLSISSGTRKLSYYASGSYFHQGTILKTDANSNDRITYRLNTVSHFDKIGLEVTTGIDGYVEKGEVPNSSTAGSYYSLFSHIQDKHSNQLAFNEFGLPSAQTTDNPAVELSSLSGYNKSKSRIFNSILALDWSVPFVKGLHLKSKGSYNMWNSMGKSWSQTAASYNNGSKVPIPGNPPSLSETWGEGNTFTLQNYITYTHDFNLHHIDFTGVYEQAQQSSSSLSGLRQQYQIIYDQFIAGPTENQQANGYESENARASYIGRLTYNYASKYFLDVTFRRDGMDLFPPDNRWGNFYAVSGGWIVSSEPFFQSLKNNNILNYLKLRGSTGRTGSVDGIGSFQYVPGYNINANAWVVDGQEQQGTSEPGSLPSTNFSWFSIKSWDIGLDFATLENRLTGSIDYYYKRTTGYVVADTRFSATLGIGLPPINFKDAALRRAGTEFDLNWKDQAGAFNYQLGFNFTYFDQLWERNPSEDEAALKNPYTRSSGTSDANLQTGYINDGFYQNNQDLLNGARRISSVNVVAGDLKYEDINGDGKIDGADFRRIGDNSFPRINYGFTFQLGYKGFYLNGSIMGTGGRDRYLGDVIQGSSAQTQMVYGFQNDYWRPDNKDAIFPRAVSSGGVNGNNNFVTSNFWLLRSTFIRLKALQLGYDLNKNLLKRSPFTTFKVFVSGTNLLTSSKSLKYYIDPESDPNNYNYPIQRTFSLGLNVGF